MDALLHGELLISPVPEIVNVPLDRFQRQSSPQLPEDATEVPVDKIVVDIKIVLKNAVFFISIILFI